MKNTTLILFLSIFFFAISCNDDTECPVVEPEPTEVPKIIQLNEPFIAKVGEKWHYESDSDTFDISVTGILDSREYGDCCAVSTGGYAEIFVMQYLNHFRRRAKFTWPGCDGTNEFDVSNSNLPTASLDPFGYSVKMMKMYPLSEMVDVSPNELDDFEIKLVVVK